MGGHRSPRQICRWTQGFGEHGSPQPDPQGIQEFGGHWECLTLPPWSSAAIPTCSQPPGQSGDSTGSRNGLGRAQGTRHRPLLHSQRGLGGVGRDGGLGVGMGRGDSVLEKGQCSGEGTVPSHCWPQPGHHRDRPQSRDRSQPPRGHLKSFGTNLNHGRVSAPAGSVLGGEAVPASRGRSRDPEAAAPRVPQDQYSGHQLCSLPGQLRAQTPRGSGAPNEFPAPPEPGRPRRPPRAGPRAPDLNWP